MRPMEGDGSALPSACRSRAYSNVYGQADSPRFLLSPANRTFLRSSPFEKNQFQYSGGGGSVTPRSTEFSHSFPRSIQFFRASQSRLQFFGFACPRRSANYISIIRFDVVLRKAATTGGVSTNISKRRNLGRVTGFEAYQSRHRRRRAWHLFCVSKMCLVDSHPYQGFSPRMELNGPRSHSYVFA